MKTDLWLHSHPQDYPLLLHTLNDMADLEYLSFNQRIIPNLGFSYGVRLPVLRRLANALAKNPEKDGLWMCLVNGASFEEKILAGMTVHRLTSNGFDEVHHRLETLVERIDNWAVCDTAAGGLKDWATTNADDFFRVLPAYLQDGRAWARRFGLVLLLHFRQEAFVDKILSYTMLFQREEAYYVQMGVAWLVSMLYPISPESVLRWLKTYNHPEIVNLTVRKILESRQVASGEKEMVRTLKRDCAKIMLQKRNYRR